MPNIREQPKRNLFLNSTEFVLKLSSLAEDCSKHLRRIQRRILSCQICNESKKIKLLFEKKKIKIEFFSFPPEKNIIQHVPSESILTNESSNSCPKTQLRRAPKTPKLCEKKPYLGHTIFNRKDFVAVNLGHNLTRLKSETTLGRVVSKGTWRIDKVVDTSWWVPSESAIWSQVNVGPPVSAFERR